MHLAYSALQTQSPQTAANTMDPEEFTLRIKTYLATCEKYSKEIAAIRKYIPGWIPEKPGN